MRTLKLVSVLIVIGLVSIFGFVQSGLFNVAATKEDGPLLVWLMHTTMEKSVAKRAGKINVPELGDHKMVLAGVSDYVGMCAQCHGEPGQQPGALAQGLNPSPPDLQDLTEDGTAAEKFWIISHGIRMTGMPAFGKTHGPDEIWPVVAFLQFAKDLDTAAYNSLVTESKDYGHHANDEGQGQEHDDQPHDHATAEPNASTSTQQGQSHGDDGHADDDHEIVPPSSITDDELLPDNHEQQTPDSQHSHSPDAAAHSH
jgi:cytochrome c553